MCDIDTVIKYSNLYHTTREKMEIEIVPIGRHQTRR